MPEKGTLAGRPGISAWHVQLLRFTAFQTPASRISAVTWWEDLIKQPPERKTTKPKEQLQQEEGSFEAGKLVLTMHPMRIDWVYSGIDKEPEEESVLPTIGTLSNALKPFIQLVDNWFQLNTMPPVQRTALGMVLWQPVENRQKGYAQLSKYLTTVRLDSENSSDFLYQINRPRASKSGLANLRINRLSQWSISSRRGIAMSFAPEGVTHTMGQERFACHLLLDINTAADFKNEIPKEKLVPILEEFCELAVEIATEGDIQ